MSNNLKSGDNPELEELFDSIVGSAPVPKPQLPAEVEAEPKVEIQPDPKSKERAEKIVEEFNEEAEGDVFTKIGKLTRRLNDVIKDLGYQEDVEDAISTLPDTRSRLEYVTTLTSRAAERVLASIDKLQAIQTKLSIKSYELDQEITSMINGELTVDEFKDHYLKVRDYFKDYKQDEQQINIELTELMLSQDFHDLTGQVIGRITDTTTKLEKELVRILLDVAPVEKKDLIDTAWLSGPTVKVEGRTDVCANQEQVDDLLTSLGF